ncbi:MAG: hypothetical protein AAGJ29_09290 [Pseudomonadota bacterium]
MRALEDVFGENLGTDAEFSASHYTLKRWIDADSRRRDRAGLVVQLSGVALSYLSANPTRLGLRPQAENIVAAVSGSLAAHFAANENEIANHAFTTGSRKRIGEMLLSASLQAAESHPEAFSESEPVQALIRAAASPLRVLNHENALADYTIGKRLSAIRDALRGPVGTSVLTTLYEQRQTLFDESYPERASAASIVTDAFFEGIVDMANDADLGALFRPTAFANLYPKVIAAVGARPGAFIRGEGHHISFGREFLTDLMDALSPEGRRLAPDLTGAVFDLGISLSQKHAKLFLVQEAQGFVSEWVQTEAAGKTDPWALLQIRLAAQIADKMVSKFESSESAKAILLAPTNQPFLLELVGTIAEQVAETPGMIGSDINPEILRITEGIASFVASEHADLLTRADWRTVASRAVELSLANPGRVFGLNDQDPRQFFLTNLISRILSTAHTSLLAQTSGVPQRERRPGGVLFGETLGQAMMIALQKSVTHLRTTDLANAEELVISLVTQLNDMSATERHGRQLSAEEWLFAFDWYLADVLSTQTLTLAPKDVFELLDRRSGIQMTKTYTERQGEFTVEPVLRNGETYLREDAFYKPASIDGAAG